MVELPAGRRLDGGRRQGFHLDAHLHRPPHFGRSPFQYQATACNEVFLRAKKNGGDVFAYIPDWLRDRLVARSRTWGAMLFRVGESERLDTVTDTWRRKLNKVFELAGKFEEKPKTHRFRHTF